MPHPHIRTSAVLDRMFDARALARDNACCASSGSFRCSFPLAFSFFFRGALRPSSSPHTTKNWPVQVETDPRQLNLASLSRNGQSVALTPTGVRQGTRALWQASARPCTGTSHRKSGLCPLSPHPRSPPFTLNSLATAGPPTAGSLPPLVQDRHAGHRRLAG